MRSAVAARFLTLRVLTDSTFPPLTRLSGQSPSHEVNAGALGNCERSGPISANRVCVVRTLIPGMHVRSTRRFDTGDSASRIGVLHHSVFGRLVTSGGNLRGDPLSTRRLLGTAQFHDHRPRSTFGNDGMPPATGRA